MTFQPGAVAIVGIGRTSYARNLGPVTSGALALQACKLAIEDAGIRREDIDGIAGFSDIVTPLYVKEGLGIEVLNWHLTPQPAYPYSFAVGAAVSAIASGMSETALVYSSELVNRTDSSSIDFYKPPHPLTYGWQTSYEKPYAPMHRYAGLMRRFMHEFGVTRESFAMLSVNNRTYATQNEQAVFREALSIRDYLSARMVYEPMCLLDMDYPIEHGDALVLMSADRARAKGLRCVYVDSIAYGEWGDQSGPLTQLGCHVAMERLWKRGTVSLADIDVFEPYDGFSIIAMAWIDAAGYSPQGEVDRLLKDAWRPAESRLLIEGRVPIDTHGGSLSEGRSGGANHFFEAVSQLRGTAGMRQVAGAKTALVTAGGAFINVMAVILRRD